MVHHLTHKDFELGRKVQIVKRGMRGQPGILLVWAEWCGHCIRFKPDFERLSKILGKDFRCAMLESKQLEASPQLNARLKVEGFPTLKFFDQEGSIIADYPARAPRDIDTMLKYICDVYHKCARSV